MEGPNSTSARGSLAGMVACPPNGIDAFAQFNGKAVYKGFVQSYSTVEPAIDLTASSFLAFSWQIAGVPSALLNCVVTFRKSKPGVLSNRKFS